ncbi:hypothetical protein G6F56_007132 [Rhizopus delemar]|nr:hypothetical protein G6F56_007132 [Rhizopus delemar]
MMTSLGAEMDSETSDDEWVITSLEKKKTKAMRSNNSNKRFTPQQQTRISKPLKKESTLLQYKTQSSSSSTSSLTLSPSVSLPPPSIASPAMSTVNTIEIPMEYLSKTELEDICKTMDPKRLITQLIRVYKSLEIFTKIRDIETGPMSFEIRLKEQLESCQDPCSFVIDCLEALSVHFSINAKMKELTPKFRRVLTEMLCRGLTLYLNTLPEKKKQEEEPDLITFEEEDGNKEVDLISFDESALLVQIDDTESEDSSDDDSIPIITFTEPSVNKCYNLTRTHQDKMIALIDSISSPVVIYYALDAFKLDNLIAADCEREEEGVRLSRRMLKYGYFSETVNTIKRLNLFSYFPIPSIASEMLNAGQGALLPTLVFSRSDLQLELLQFIEKQLRFNFAGSLGIVPPDKLAEMHQDSTKQLPRLKERKFQKDLVTCGVKIAHDRNMKLTECYFIHLSQRYASLRWILAQRALQQMEDHDLSIEKSSNYNGLIDIVCEQEPALAKLAIKELVDMGDTVAPAYFATHYKEQPFYCMYTALPMNERCVGVVKGEQISRHWTSLGPKKPTNPNKLPYYRLPLMTNWMFVNSEKSLIFMKDILSRSHLCGIDTEWVPAFATITPAKTALMQIASDIGGYIFLLDLKTVQTTDNKLIYKLAEKILQFLFEDDEILKIGKTKFIVVAY